MYSVCSLFKYAVMSESQLVNQHGQLYNYTQLIQHYEISVSPKDFTVVFDVVPLSIVGNLSIFSTRHHKYTLCFIILVHIWVLLLSWVKEVSFKMLHRFYPTNHYLQKLRHWWKLNLLWKAQRNAGTLPAYKTTVE